MNWNKDTLNKKHLLVIGCGGLAHAALPYLLSSGLGELTLYDADVVETSNLNRQHLFTPSNLGKNKATTLNNYFVHHFPHATIHAEPHMFLSENISHLAHFDLVLDFTDRLSTKMKLAAFFESKKIPYFYAAAQVNSGASAFVHTLSLTSEQLFGHITNTDVVERDCAIDDVWPTVVAEVGLHVAHQAIQYLTLTPCPFIGSLDYFNGSSGMWSRFSFQPKTEFKEKTYRIEELLKDSETPIFFLGEKDALPNKIHAITASELREEICRVNRSCILVCDSGTQAKIAAEHLSKSFEFPILSWNGNYESFLNLMKNNH